MTQKEKINIRIGTKDEKLMYNNMRSKSLGLGDIRAKKNNIRKVKIKFSQRRA